MLKCSNAQMIKWSNCEIVKLWPCGIVTLWNCGVETSRNCACGKSVEFYRSFSQNFQPSVTNESVKPSRLDHLGDNTTVEFEERVQLWNSPDWFCDCVAVGEWIDTVPWQNSFPEVGAATVDARTLPARQHWHSHLLRQSIGVEKFSILVLTKKLTAECEQLADPMQIQMRM